jgi:ribosomal protein L11 methyltransferase
VAHRRLPHRRGGGRRLRRGNRNRRRPDAHSREAGRRRLAGDGAVRAAAGPRRTLLHLRVHDRGLAPDNAVNLRIEAGAAFGTGHHGTTVGCLLAYDRLLKRRRFERVLDVGCGTGVLAIAAARTHSRLALGTDIDPVSVRIANENAAVNHAKARFVHAAGLAHPLIRRGGPYDLVFANILAGPLIALAWDIRAVLAPGGVAILSGLLRVQARAVSAAYLARGFRIHERRHRDAWTTLVLVRP